MRSNKIISLLTWLFILSVSLSCNNKNKSIDKFDREEYVFRYLKEVAQINTHNQNEFLLFIVNNNVCNCSGDIKEIIGTNFSDNKLTKYLIAVKYDSSIIDTLKSRLTQLSIFIDKDNNLSKYGINNATHYLFDIKDEKILFWCPINNDTKDELKEKYFTQIP